MAKINILYVVSEADPFAKTGGLGDVAGSLPRALEKLGNDIRIILPRYKCVSKDKYNLKLIDRGLKVRIGDEIENVKIYEAVLPGSEVVVYFVENHKYFGSRNELYVNNGRDYPDNLERFILFPGRWLSL